MEQPELASIPPAGPGRAARSLRAVPVGDFDEGGETGVQEQLLAFAHDLNRIYQQERTRSGQLSRALQDLEESYYQMIKAFAFLVEARDPNTRSHLSRAHDYAVALAKRVDPSLADDRIFRYGFLLHDIGKVGIPDHILRKPSPLTHDEWEVMKTHPLLGGQILTPITYLRRAIPIVECHHERWDGSGYPRGLRGEDIPAEARIFAVVDTFDAMTSDRPYREALTINEAVGEIRRAGGTQLDPLLAEEFAQLCEERTEAWPLEAPPPGHPDDPRPRTS